MNQRELEIKRAIFKAKDGLLRTILNNKRGTDPDIYREAQMEVARRAGAS